MYFVVCIMWCASDFELLLLVLFIWPLQAWSSLRRADAIVLKALTRCASSISARFISLCKRTLPLRALERLSIIAILCGKLYQSFYLPPKLQQDLKSQSDCVNLSNEKAASGVYILKTTCGQESASLWNGKNTRTNNYM